MILRQRLKPSVITSRIISIQTKNGNSQNQNELNSSIVDIYTYNYLTAICQIVNK